MCVRERERRGGGRGGKARVGGGRGRGGGGGGVCLIGKQMNNVNFITGMETERRPQQMLCLQERVILVV